MRQVAKCQCGAKSGMHLILRKDSRGKAILDDTGKAIMELKGNCVICGMELDPSKAQTIRGPQPVPEPELDLLEIL